MIYNLLKYSYVILIPLLTGGVLYNKSPAFKKLILDSMFLYLASEAKVISVLKKINRFIILYLGNDIFYYCDGICIYKSSLKNFDNLDTPLDYDYLICKKLNEQDEEMTRLFDTEEEFINEYYRNDNSIKFKFCKKSLINVKITFISTYEDKLHNTNYNITPLKTSYCSGNKLFTKNYMKHFFNMELPEKYVIDMIDSEITSSKLSNKEEVELWDDDYTILETQEKVIIEDSEHKSDLSLEDDWETTENIIK